MLFVTNIHDAQGLAALEVLGRHNYETQVLAERQPAPMESIALFTPLRMDFQGSRGRYLRCSAIKLGDGLAPEWVKSTKQRVAVVRLEKGKQDNISGNGKRNVRRCYANYQGSLESAVLKMARNYSDWIGGKSNLWVPWGTTRQDRRLLPSSLTLKQIESWLESNEVAEFRRIWLIRKKPDDHSIRTIPIAGWQVNITDQRKVFPAFAAEQALGLLEPWAGCFPREKTWVQGQWNLPSLLVRFDCIVQNGQLVVYEIEERPAGIGLTSLTNQEFAGNFAKLAATWPQFRVEVSPLRRATDDPLWIKTLGWDQANTDLVLVRAEPEELQYHSLESQSVSSLKSKGDKSYGQTMGLWRRVSDPGELNWNGCFVLKPL